jgi:hypothetical protein
MALEMLARLVSRSTVSTPLMQMALRRHGIVGDKESVWVPGCRDSSAAHATPEGPVSGCFVVNVRDDQLWHRYRTQFHDTIPAVIEDADRICRHEFALLGSDRTFWGDPIDWHWDPVSGYRWPKAFYGEIKSANQQDAGYDVKLPWELSRMQHLPTLGKAYRLTHNERYAKEIVSQLLHWMDDNPCSIGVNWTCPMDIAIRIVNILWAYLFIADAAVVSPEVRSRLAHACFQHAQFIVFHLEYSMREDGVLANSNHYLADIVGLLHLGLLCPLLPMAATWQQIGVTALVEEMECQVYPDGGDFESSLPYHRLVLEFFTAGALLCRANGVMLPAAFWERLERMFALVLQVMRPDGRLPQVGDADDGRLFILSNYGAWDRTEVRYLLSIGAALFQRQDMKAQAGGFSEEAFWLLGPSGLEAFAAVPDASSVSGSQQFDASGLYVMRTQDRYLLACCGEVGTGGLGNHKHNDLLSFELYAGDKAFIVDPGAYVYSRHPTWRNLFRSTRYHNTVVIDDQEQNRFTARRLFQMTADATVVVHQWLTTPERDWLDVEHTGYSRLVPPVQHRRTFLFDKLTGTWEITDHLTGAGEHTADWYVHFDHGIDLVLSGDQRFRTVGVGTNLDIVIRTDIALVCDITEGWVSRRYGHKLPAKILHLRGIFHTRCCLTLLLQPIAAHRDVPVLAPGSLPSNTVR